jgi:galactokinase
MVPTHSRVEASGLRADAAASKAALFERARRALAARRADGREAAFFVPGRIEVLGKHTDYAGGRSLLCAAEQGFCIVAAPRRDRRVSVVNAETGERAGWDLAPDVRPQLGHWSNYPATVVRRVVRNFPDLVAGADIAFASDLPQASGMSSSSAFMVGIFLALADLSGLDHTAQYQASIESPEDLAGYLATIENGRSFGGLVGDLGVGTFGGSEDHTAILCCRPGTLSQYRFAPVAFERHVRMPSGHVFVVAFSGLLAEKTGAALETYNRASRAAAQVLAIWREASGRSPASLEEAVAGGPEAAASVREAIAAVRDTEFPTDLLLSRFDQFVLESRGIVPEAGDALEAGQLDRFAVLVDRSQRAVEEWLGNQVPETVFLAREARRLGAVAASAFGAGFGGSVWALVPEPRGDRFARNWQDAYARVFPAAAGRAAFIRTCPGPAAFRLR